MRARLTIAMSLLLAAAVHAGTSTLGDGDSYAWAANIGWIELIPSRPAPGDGIIVTDTHLSGFGWSDSTGWINFGDGTPAGGIRYSNTDGSDSGVNQDGAGNLSGLAWSANLGWINFGWAELSNPNRPRFNLLNGVFQGYAWSANAGWINLESGLLKTDFVCVSDADSDGISDAWEMHHTSLMGGGESAPTLTALTATGDADGDGASDLEEYFADSNPFAAADRLELLSIAPGGIGTVLTWTSRPTRVYRIGQSTNLTTWDEGSVLLPDPGDQTTREAVHGRDTRRFFKVRALIPLAK